MRKRKPPPKLTVEERAAIIKNALSIDDTTIKDFDAMVQPIIRNIYYAPWAKYLFPSLLKGEMPVMTENLSKIKDLFEKIQKIKNSL